MRLKRIFKKYFQWLGAIISLSLTSHHALASVDVYLGVDIGSMQMKETLGGSDYTNQGTFFIGHWGYSLGIRPQLKLGSIGLGVVGELSWISESMDRRLSGSSSVTTYRSEFYRYLSGASLSFFAGNSSSIILEYYPLVQNTVKYSDNKTLNPHQKNDKLKSDGYGVGFNFGFNNTIAYQLIYKRLNLRSGTMSGVEVKFPNDQYSLPNLEEVMFGFVLRY